MSLSKMPLQGNEQQVRDIIIKLIYIRDIPTQISEEATAPSTAIDVCDISNALSSNLQN